jgi:hypothetical protein
MVKDLEKTCSFRVPEENPALAGLLAIIRRLFLLSSGGEFPIINADLYFLVAATLCGKEVEGLWLRDLPPMLAAQSAFPSGPPGYLKYLVTNLR